MLGPRARADARPVASGCRLSIGIAAVACGIAALLGPPSMLPLWRIGFVASLASKAGRVSGQVAVKERARQMSDKVIVLSSSGALPLSPVAGLVDESCHFGLAGGAREA
eukprot:5483620-Pyramimonas_sp.AAC.1